MRVMAGSLSRSILLALCDEIESTCLVRECRDMEEWFGTHFTNDIIKRKITCSFKEMKKAIIVADKKMRVEKCGEKAPTIARVAESPGWAKLWDALDLGWKVVQGLKMLSRAMSYHGKGERPCHLCDTTTSLQEESLLDHILTRYYQELYLNSESILDSSKVVK